MKHKTKCPSCKCEETIRNSFTEDGRVVEEKIVCKNCGRIKMFWSYGLEEFNNWKDLTNPPLFKRIRDLILLKKRTKLTKKQQGKFDKELPF